MTAQSAEGSIGARIRAIRKARGIRTTRELAELMTGSSVTESIIENIESGRKVNLEVTQLLNIAMALEVPPSYLLAPMGAPTAAIDLPGLSDTFGTMTALQFDAWLSGTAAGAYTSGSANDRYARMELDALRELMTLDAEIRRLKVLIRVSEEASDKVGVFDFVTSYEHRIDYAAAERSELHAFLTSSGWDLPEMESPTLSELD